MPISREEFERGAIDLSIPIISYMTLRGEEAFSAVEIHFALREIFERRTTLAEVVVVLASLVEERRVDLKEIAGQRMYTILEPNE